MSKIDLTNCIKRGIGIIKLVNFYLVFIEFEDRGIGILAIMSAPKRWTMPLQKWKPTMNRFAIEFEGSFHV